MSRKKIEFIFADGTHPIVKYKDFEKNYIFWFKEFLYTKTNHLSDIKVINKEQFKFEKNKLLSLNTIDEIKELVNNLSKNGFKGLKQYFNTNLKLLNFLKKHKFKSIEQINTSAIVEFMKEELDGLSGPTKRNTLVGIKNFLAFIEDNNYIDGSNSHSFNISKNVFKTLKIPRKPKIAFIHPKDELPQFIEAIERVNWIETDKARNRLLIKVLLFTGIRVDEALSLKNKNVHLDIKNNLVLNIVGKGNKPRSVLVSNKLILNDYMQWTNSNKFASSEEDYFFNTISGKKLTDYFSGRLVKSVLQEANISKKEKNSNHLLRHTCFTMLASSKKYDAMQLKKFADHENIATTEIYIHLGDEIVKEMSENMVNILESLSS